MEQQLNIIEGLVEVSATCTKCNKVVQALADPGRFTQMIEKLNDPNNKYGEYYTALQIWSESSHWYRELMQAHLINEGLIESSYADTKHGYGYYCDNCFNRNYPEGIDDSDSFKDLACMQLFDEMLEEHGIPRHLYDVKDDSQYAYWQEQHKALYRRATKIVYGPSKFNEGY